MEKRFWPMSTLLYSKAPVWVTFLVKQGESKNRSMRKGPLLSQIDYLIHLVNNRQTPLTRNDFTFFLNDSNH